MRGNDRADELRPSSRQIQEMCSQGCGLLLRLLGEISQLARLIAKSSKQDLVIHGVQGEV
jgi:hypothetical protein